LITNDSQVGSELQGVRRTVAAGFALCGSRHPTRERQV